MIGITPFRNRATASAIGRGIRLGLLVAAACSLAACTKSWGPIYHPIDDEEDYPRKFCGIFFDCSHDEYYEPGGDGPEDGPEDRPSPSSPPSGGPVSPI